MTRRIDRHLPTVASSVAIFISLVLAAFYYGPQIPLLAGAELLLVAWLTISILRRYDDGVPLPRTILTLCLTLFWCWLGITLLWSPVPGTSAFNFWWIGSFALAFWAYTIAPDREHVWRWIAPLALTGAAILCVYALIQVTVLGEPPRATFINIHSFAALLMLLSLPTAAYFMIEMRRTDRRVSAWLLGAALFLLWFTIAATQGRGTTISLMLAVGVLLALSWRDTPRRHVARVVVILGAAYAGANLILQGAVVDRFATLADPGGAALPRWLIWRGSWEMVKDNPWLGIGLGNYYLAWPQYRDPADSTLGFFVHNDYLQIWIEAGLPGLLLFAAMLASVVVMTIRMLRVTQATATLRIEVLGLFSGLLSVAVHSLLDFNLYILAISIAAGLMLGRWHERVTAVVPASVFSLQLRQRLQRPAHRLIVVLVALFPILYLISLGVAEILYQRAIALAARGLLQEADAHFTWAENLMPSADRYYLPHADLYRFVLVHTPPQQADARRAVYNEALILLERVQATNPYRAMVHDIRGRLYQDAADIVGSDWREKAFAEYRRALALNPRLLRTRLVYAHLLLATGDRPAATALLEEGARHWYHPEPALIPYYEMLAQLLRSQGRIEAADQFAARGNEAKQALASFAQVRPVVGEEVSLVRAASGNAVAGPIFAPKAR